MLNCEQCKESNQNLLTKPVCHLLSKLFSIESSCMQLFPCSSFCFFFCNSHQHMQRTTADSTMLHVAHEI